ncbi:MAG TPA: hypothetical protein VHO91_06435 [Rhodopila sp.]|nr:hypothetical protein [Rhodopila sp.]
MNRIIGGIFMNRIIERLRVEALGNRYWLSTQHGGADILDAMKHALAPDWTVDKVTDCNGEESVIILPASLDSAISFILYEEEARLVVATVRDDEWAGFSRFASLEAAVTALLAIVRQHTGMSSQAAERPLPDVHEAPAGTNLPAEPPAIGIGHLEGRFFIAPSA